MTTFEKESTLSCSAKELYDWHGREGAFERLVPPWQNARVISRKGGIGAGAEIRVRLRHFGIRRDWLARIAKSESGCGFEDEQIDGPFASRRHRHDF